jgi:hypothetical protein
LIAAASSSDSTALWLTGLAFTVRGLSRESVHLALNRLEPAGLCRNRYGGIVVASAWAPEETLMRLGLRGE